MFEYIMCLTFSVWYRIIRIVFLVILVGYTRGGTQVQGFKSAGKQNFAHNNNVTLVHESKVYVTVVARNSASLQGVAYSVPFLVDLTHPDIAEVNDGIGINILYIVLVYHQIITICRR